MTLYHFKSYILSKIVKNISIVTIFIASGIVTIFIGSGFIRSGILDLILYIDTTVIPTVAMRINALIYVNIIHFYLKKYLVNNLS